MSGWGGGWSSQVVVANQVIIEGPDDFELVYSGPAALGNLITSIAPVSGVDGFGNFYFAGTTQYTSSGGKYYATNMNGSVATFISTAGPGGPYSLQMAYAGGIGLGTVHSFGVVNPVSTRALEILTPTAAAGDNGASLVMQANPSGTPSNNQFSGLLQTSDNGGDGTLYDTGRITLASTAVFNVTTGANFFAYTVFPRMYEVTAEFVIQNVAVTSICPFGFTGPAVANPNRYSIDVLDLSATAVEPAQTARLNTLSGLTMTAGRNYLVKLRGVFNFTAAGTFALEVGVTAVGDTWTIEDGAVFDVLPCSTSGSAPPI